MNDPYENLAQAVILQAVKDYRTERAELKYYPKNKDTKFMIEDCERFFRSEWFGVLTSVDGQLLLRRLQEEELS